MAAVFAFGKRGANNRAPVSNYLISKGFDFDGIKNHQLSWWFDGEPLKAVSKDSATFGMGLWDH